MRAGITPCDVIVHRRSIGNFTIEKEGYETVSLSQSRVVNGWLFGNLLLGGIPGLIVDFATGNFRKHSERPIHLHLRKR